MEETQMDSIVITTGSPNANTSDEPNINAARLRGIFVLVLSQMICLALAGMVVVLCTGLRYVPKKDQYTEDNTDEKNLSCIQGIVSGLVMLTIFGLFGFSVFVIQFISKIKSENPYFDRLRWCDLVAVLIAFVISILCVVFGAVTKHRQGCVRFLQDKDPNYIFYMNFMIVYGTITTIVDAVFIWLSVQEFDWRRHQKNQEKISEEQKRKPHEKREKAREKQVRKAASKNQEQKTQEQKESDEKEVQRRMASETPMRRESEVSTRRQAHLLDQNLVVAKRIETAVDDAVVSTTIRVSEIQETEGGSEFDVQCVTCRSEDPDHAFVPCGHTCVCESCAEVHRRRRDPCPICRGRQNGLIKIFK
jgi:hypothetical protein